MDYIQSKDEVLQVLASAFECGIRLPPATDLRAGKVLLLWKEPRCYHSFSPELICKPDQRATMEGVQDGIRESPLKPESWICDLNNDSSIEARFFANLPGLAKAKTEAKRRGFSHLRVTLEGRYAFGCVLYLCRVAK